MRPLEIVLCCFMFSAFIAWMAGLRVSAYESRIGAIVVLVLLAIHAMREGMHWQMTPLYLAALIFVLVEITLRPVAPVHLRWLAISGFILIACTGLISYFLPMFRLPTPTGKYAIGTRILYLVDPTRDAMGSESQNGHRELVVQVWYPAEPNGEPLAVYRRRLEATPASSYQSVLRTNSYLNAHIDPAKANYPLLLFNPAWTGQRTQSTFLTQELASHGFIVASIDHTYYSGKVAFPDGRVIDSKLAPPLGSFLHTTIEEELAMGTKYTRIEAEDDIFVLDQLQSMNQNEGSFCYKCMDMQRVGVLGHSFGGSVAAEVAYLDPRVKAAVNMDGWMFGDAMSHGISKPFMLIFEKGSDDEPPHEVLIKAPEGVQRYWQMDQRIMSKIHAGLHLYGGYEIYIRGTSHWNFSDKALYSPVRRWTDAGPINPARAYMIIDEYVVAFFSNALNGAQENLLEGHAPKFPEAEFNCWRGQAEERNIGVSQ